MTGRVTAVRGPPRSAAALSVEDELRRSDARTLAERGRDGPQQQLEVGGKTQVVDVLEVDLGVFVHQPFTAARHLPQAGDARLDGVPAVLPRLVVRDDRRQLRTGTDKAHLTAQHVPELRKLVEAQLAQEPPGSGDAGVLRNLVQDPPVGAGPQRLESYQPGQLLRMAKNPTYWDAKNIRVAAVEFVHIGAGPQRLNALRSGAVHMSTIETGDISALGGSRVQIGGPRRDIRLPGSRPDREDVREDVDAQLVKVQWHGGHRADGIHDEHDVGVLFLERGDFGQRAHGPCAGLVVDEREGV